MRQIGYAASGTHIVLLTLEIPNDEVLLSDFDKWHFVLNNCYLPIDDNDDESHTEAETIQSWNRIFDLSDNPQFVQATTWSIQKVWVKKAEFFIAR